MLIQSRSKACRTCQIRKYKCGRERPGCFRCAKDGWTCPGYLVTWKREPRRHLPYEKEWLPEPNNTGQSPNEKSRNVNIRPALQLPHISISSLSATTILSNRLASHLESKRLQGLSIRNLGVVFDFLPVRLGHNQALDDAVQCICTIYESILSSQDLTIRSHRQEYYQAIKSLRCSLSNPREALSDETLCAAVILSWFEILADNIDDYWLEHIRGCALLIQLRGPERHVTGFAKAIFRSQEGLISGDCLIRHEPSFLDLPLWRDVVARQRENYKDPFVAALIRNNKHSAHLSTLRKQLDLLLDHEDPNPLELSVLFRKLEHFRGESKDLFPDTKATDEIFPNNGLSLMYFKQELTLLSINTSIIKILDTPYGDSLIPEKYEGSGYYLAGPPSIESLNLEMEETLKHMFEHLSIARRESPFSTRNMAFMCRIMFYEMRKRYGELQSIWKQLEVALCKISEDGFWYRG